MDDYKTSIPVERIERSIFFIRGHKILLDSDLADLYDVETRNLIQAVKRNIERFPPDFMFQLAQDEFDSLRSQIVTSKGRGGRRYLPYAFTEQGVAMLSSVFRSKRAIQVNIAIMRVFVRLDSGLKRAWRTVDTAPLSNIQDYPAWIAEYDVAVILLDERLNEQVMTLINNG